MKIKNGFTLIEVIISVTIFTILFTSIIWGFVTLIKLEIKSRENIYKKIKETDEIIQKYFIEEN
jgi:prepilin-type N-terminal cleavage/methylation domain-containing protein